MFLTFILVMNLTMNPQIQANTGKWINGIIPRYKMLSDNLSSCDTPRLIINKGDVETGYRANN